MTGDAFYRPPPSCEFPDLARHYAELFGLRRRGTFVEFGAYDGRSFSNTSFLADLGWRGVYVEPVEEYARSCLGNHRGNDVVVYNVAVAYAPGQARMSVARSVSSMSRDHVAQVSATDWGKALHAGDVRTVEVVTPERIFEAEGIAAFELLVVDVEGTEWPVVRALDLRRRRPAVAIVEVQDATPGAPVPLRDASRRVIARFLDHGYRIRARTNKDVMFVHDGLLAALPPADPGDGGAAGRSDGAGQAAGSRRHGPVDP